MTETIDRPETLKEISVRLEHYETPEWAAKAILQREILTQTVIDPCTGTGILDKAAKEAGYRTYPFDIHNWSYNGTEIMDWLSPTAKVSDWLLSLNFSVLMNPPFSEAVEFVKQSIDLGARKVVAFQRFAWWESRGRRDFWRLHPPNRVYVCGDRASCWRHDLEPEERTSGTTTAHAWFVWERGHPPGTQMDQIWKDNA